MDKTGYVVLKGRKILITVRIGNTSKWIAARHGEEGPRLQSIENALKKKNGAAQKLLDWKQVPL